MREALLAARRLPSPHLDRGPPLSPDVEAALKSACSTLLRDVVPSKKDCKQRRAPKLDLEALHHSMYDRRPSTNPSTSSASHHQQRSLPNISFSSSARRVEDVRSGMIASAHSAAVQGIFPSAVDAQAGANAKPNIGRRRETLQHAIPSGDTRATHASPNYHAGIPTKTALLADMLRARPSSPLSTKLADNALRPSSANGTCAVFTVDSQGKSSQRSLLNQTTTTTTATFHTDSISGFWVKREMARLPSNRPSDRYHRSKDSKSSLNNPLREPVPLQPDARPGSALSMRSRSPESMRARSPSALGWHSRGVSRNTSISSLRSGTGTAATDVGGSGSLGARWAYRPSKLGVDLNRDLPALPDADEWLEQRSPAHSRSTTATHVASLMRPAEGRPSSPKLELESDEPVQPQPQAEPHPQPSAAKEMMARRRPMTSDQPRPDSELLPLNLFVGLPDGARPRAPTDASVERVDSAFADMSSVASASSSLASATAPTTSAGSVGPAAHRPQSVMLPSSAPSSSGNDRRKRLTLGGNPIPSSTSITSTASTTAAAAAAGHHRRYRSQADASPSSSVYGSMYPHAVEITSAETGGYGLPERPLRGIKKLTTALFGRRDRRQKTWMDEIESMGVKYGVVCEERGVGGPVVRY